MLPLRNAKLGYEYDKVLIEEGFQDGDIIYAFDGVEQYDFAEATQTLVLHTPKEVTVMRGDSLVTFGLSQELLSKIASRNPKRILKARYPFVVKDFSPGSVGKHYGLQIGDSLVSICGRPTPSANDFMTVIGDYADDSVVVGLYRNGQYTEVRALLGGDGKLGIFAENDMSKLFVVNHKDYTLWQAIPAGIKYGVETLVTYVTSMKVLFTPGGFQGLGGFITMGSMFPNTWDWHRFWDITALLAIVLAFMNIIPIPGLDGGHIVITLYEMITRKPVNEKALDIIQKIGLAFLLALLIVANGNDLIRLFNGWMR